MFSVPALAQAQDAARPEVGKTLQAAQEQLRQGHYKDALAKVREADATGNKTDYEIYLIERMRGSAAMGTGDNETAIKAFEAVLASKKAPANDQLKIAEALAGAYYRAQNYAAAIKWATRYFHDGGSSAQMHTLQIQAYFQSGDVANAAREAQADIQDDVSAGKTPSEDKLLLLANCYLKQNNSTGYVATIEKLLTYYPKKSLWAEVISRIRKKSGFSDRLSLDVYRLQQATGNLVITEDYMEMAQLALQAGLPNEARKVVDDGYANGALGKGENVDRQKRLKDLVDKRVAENQKQDEAVAQALPDGNALVNLGFNMGTAKGIALMEAGIKKGGLKYPEDAKLHLAILMLRAGQKAKAVQVLKTVQGTDGTRDLASLWVLYSR
ncbi:MAG: tetratricopeptide repeat protein [Proteobacteria bacterium]|nr:tetratricopeptide repeat protein [Pseudomonadota bacterium]